MIRSSDLYDERQKQIKERQLKWAKFFKVSVAYNGNHWHKLHNNTQHRLIVEMRHRQPWRRNGCGERARLVAA